MGSEGTRPGRDLAQPVFSFDDGLQRLEGLVQQLEGGALTLEDALQRYEEGVVLSQALQSQLGDAQRRVEVLRRSLEGEYRSEPLEDAP